MPITLYSWRIKDPRTGRWRVLRWKMTEEDAQAWAKKEGAELEKVPNSEETRTDVDGRQNPQARCLPMGIVQLHLQGAPRKFVQTPAVTAILYEAAGETRQIFTDGRTLPPPEAQPWWNGYSVGRWEGDTLVVDSNGFNEKTWLSRYGQSHTEALHVTERYRRRDLGHLDVDVTFTDPRAYTKPWGFTAEMELNADTEMLESICERSSDQWQGGPVAADTAVTVAPEVLARYVGVYHGVYGGDKRIIEVTLSGDRLIAKVTGRAAVDGGEMRPLIPQSQTTFDGVGIVYQFVVGDNGVATALVEIHISGPERFPKQP